MAGGTGIGGVGGAASGGFGAPPPLSFQRTTGRSELSGLSRQRMLGFSSGLPFFLSGNTLGYWLRDAGTTLAAIGFLSWVVYPLFASAARKE